MLGPLLWVSMAQSWGEEALRRTVQCSSLQNSVSGENYSLLLADLTYISIYCTLRGVLPLNYDLLPEGICGSPGCEDCTCRLLNQAGNLPFDPERSMQRHHGRSTFYENYCPAEGQVSLWSLPVNARNSRDIVLTADVSSAQSLPPHKKAAATFGLDKASLAIAGARASLIIRLK